MCPLSTKSFGPRKCMTRPPATMPPRLCPHLRQKTESAAYTEPHLTHVDSTLQCYNAAIQSNWTQNQTNPSATSCWCWTVSKVLKASSSFGFFFGRVKKWICCTYTRLKNAHDDNSMHHTTSFLHAVTMFRVMSITLQELSLMLGSMLHCRDFQFHTGQALTANMQSYDSKTNR